MASSTSHQVLAVYSRGNGSPKKKGKLHQIEFLVANSGAGIAGDGVGAAGWISGSRMQG